MFSIKGITTRSELHKRMTSFVTAAVLMVSAIVLLIMIVLIRDALERTLNERISDDITALTRIMEQRMLRVEDAAEELAGTAFPMVRDEAGLDSMLCHALRGVDDAMSIQVVFPKGTVDGIDGYFSRRSRIVSDGTVRFSSFVQSDLLEYTPCWHGCWFDGRSSWSEPITDVESGEKVISYHVPLTGPSGERAGMASIVINIGDLTSFVTKYKLRKDIDISIYSAQGRMIVAPDDYILDIPAESLITRESVIDHLGWKVILSADREIIDKNVRNSLIILALLILLMYIAMTLAINFAVRHVARPFIENKMKTERDKAAMENEMNLASGAQKGLVPHVFPPFPDRKGLDIAACLHPARMVGGDLYDYFIQDNRLYFCIGDVSGKGAQASLFMAATHYLFRCVASGMPASEAVAQINRSLCADNEQCLFVTFWYGCLDLSTGGLEYVNAGHNTPVLVRDSKASLFTPSLNVPLGAVEDMDFISEHTTLQPGDTLFLYTDGITEAMNCEGREFGTDRLLDAVRSRTGACASDLVGQVLKLVREHASGTTQSDDITMLCLKYIMNEPKQ